MWLLICPRVGSEFVIPSLSARSQGGVSNSDENSPQVVNIDIQIMVTWPQKMAATSAMESAPESPLNPAPLQLKKIYK